MATQESASFPSDPSGGILESSQATKCPHSLWSLNSRAYLIFFLQQFLHNIPSGFSQWVPIDGRSCRNRDNSPRCDRFPNSRAS